MNKPHQRKGEKSNTHVGRDFEAKAREFLAAEGLDLEPNIAVQIGVNGKKLHCFDLGCRNRKVLVECKSHRWTEGGNVPSAKMTTWNQAMYFFFAAPSGYRKIRSRSRALTQVVTQEYWLDNYSSHPGWGQDSRQARAIAILLRDHIQSDKLGETTSRPSTRPWRS